MRDRRIHLNCEPGDLGIVLGRDESQQTYDVPRGNELKGNNRLMVVL